MNRLFPEHIGNAHAWRMRKRRELKAARTALFIASAGCAYTPVSDQIRRAMNLIEEAIELCKVKRWGL